MNNSELYLKTIFCCMACDGDIATEEVEMVKKLSTNNGTFSGIDVETVINEWISQINSYGARFLKRYLNELATSKLTVQEELNIVNLAIKTIEADSRIEYSEVKFFKKIRSRLSITDDMILEHHPDKEDFLLPDISVMEDPLWENVQFNAISLK